MPETLIAVVRLPAESGVLSVDLSCPQFPQTLAGILWRYSETKAPEGKAGTFAPRSSSMPIGSPASNLNKFFLVEGAVLHHNDKDLTPYEVIVSVLLDGRAIHAEVPPEGGTGQISRSDMPFVYRFQLQGVP
jgi:hypothetical protein